MTNREWLLNQMQNMSDEELAKHVECYKIDEIQCYGNCSTCKIDWLKAEHKEPIKLSDAERVILENMPKEYKWIAREDSGDLFIYTHKPWKEKEDNRFYGWNEEEGNTDSLCLFNHLFQFIKWEDKEAYNIEELLKESQKENANKYLTIEEIKALYEEMDNNREAGDSYFTKYDGTQIPLDTGYAFEGIKLFIEEMEHKLKGGIT